MYVYRPGRSKTNYPRMLTESESNHLHKGNKKKSQSATLRSVLFSNVSLRDTLCARKTYIRKRKEQREFNTTEDNHNE